MIAELMIKIAIYSLLMIAFGETSQKDSSDEICGRFTHVIPGEKTKEKYFFSSIVSLKLFKRYGKERFEEGQCTGSILSKSLILTAASCFTSHTKVVEVTFGSEDGKGRKILSKTWKIHESYNEKSKANDLAVIEINDKIAYNDYKKPICLPIKPLSNKIKMLNVIDLNETRLLNGVMKSTVQIIDLKKCNVLSQTKEQICAFNEQPENSFKFCHGALLLREEKRRENIFWTLVGILSSFQTSSKPLLFTDISSHLDWLNEKINSSDRSIVKAKCGAMNRRRIKRIVNGDEVPNPNPYPWILFILYTSRNETGHLIRGFCAGSIIQPTFILTAAHCIPPNAESLQIYHGSSFNLHDPSTYNFISPIGLHIHPYYNEHDESTWEHDIAIIEVEQDSIDFENDHVDQICLPEDYINTDNQRMIIAGWGNTQRYDEPDYSPVLREASVVGLNSTFFRRDYCIGGSISALGLTGLASFGDSGGPLMLQRNGIWTVVGVARRICRYVGSQNCDPSCPILFTRVSNYLDWINTIIINLSIDYSDILDTSNHFQDEPRLSDLFLNNHWHSELK